MKETKSDSLSHTTFQDHKSQPTLLSNSNCLNQPNKNSGRLKRLSRRNWSQEDTKKFFRSLQLFGTDFYMINYLFNDRTRTQLKRKFKKERNNAELQASLKKCRRTQIMKLRERLSILKTEHQSINKTETLTQFTRKRFESLASVDSLDIQLVEELRQLE
ncbi:unnamed protein product (macronuclear) [Paramecium tetraurelia]|uniref:Myb-like domain-containing protein n=1 Tax=Paramecium tetraurelia TaxID=5888 RepID=A0E0G5_PARTE|nr:uncharacterized protein GSPATT00021950001 [Paramecium tetraurelia]CAK88782.1 unnamed protein product [Paramecium tetraurelia]|eukprot:XP_001456179.1 hypothetical protein (macronuclear) [Paramecium tetraurelia strain d4-2]